MNDFIDCMTVWKLDPEQGRKMIYLTPDTVELPYNSQTELLSRLRFQFFTLTAMQKGYLSSEEAIDEGLINAAV